MPVSPQQEAVCQHVQKGKGHLVVVARAGSGKTTTIREMCNRLSRPGRRILVCAFNVRIKDELTVKLHGIRGVDVKSLNQIGFGTLIKARNRDAPQVDSRKISDYLKYRVIPRELSEERGNVRDLVSKCMANLMVTDDQIRDTMARYGLYPSDKDLREPYVNWVKKVLEYVEIHGPTVTYDEQVYLPAIHNWKTGDYDFVLVDEAQDLNKSKYRLVMNAVNDRGTIIAVGDDRQCIYGFMGATADALGDFQTDLGAARLPLSVTYRCPVKVVNLAKKIVEDFEAAPNAPEGVVLKVTEKEFLEHVAEGDAVISRTNAALTKYCMLLLGKGLRARMVGRDISGDFYDLLGRTTKMRVGEALSEVKSYINERVEYLTELGKDEEAERLSDNYTALEAIGGAASSMADLRDRIDYLFADDKDVKQMSEAGVIPCLSVHKAKGLEYKRVWLLESTFRIDNEEGENLYYVAVTRAQEELYLVQIPRMDGKKVISVADRLKFFAGDTTPPPAEE